MFPVLLAAALTMACGERQERAYEPAYSTTTQGERKEYIFGIHPQRNPERLHAVFGPLIDYLNERVRDVHFVFEASRNYDIFDDKIESRRFQFVLPNPYETLLAIEHGYRVFAKMGNDADLRGLIVVRRDGSIESVDDLRGKVMGFPAPTALAATMLPKHFLFTRGLDYRRDLEVRYVGSMESSLMNVYVGNVAAGTVYPPAWRMFLKERPALAAALRIVWETEPLPNNSVMARDDVPPSLVAQVGESLLTMPETPRGRQVLALMDLTEFEAASDSTYDPVRRFLAQYRDIFGQGH